MTGWSTKWWIHQTMHPPNGGSTKQCIHQMMDPPINASTNDSSTRQMHNNTYSISSRYKFIERKDPKREPNDTPKHPSVSINPQNQRNFVSQQKWPRHGLNRNSQYSRKYEISNRIHVTGDKLPTFLAERMVNKMHQSKKYLSCTQYGDLPFKISGIGASGLHKQINI